MQARRAKRQRRENAVYIANRASADKRKRALRRRGKLHKEPQEYCVRGNIFWARLNFEERAIDIEKICARRARREFRQIAWLQSDGGASQNRYQTPMFGMDAQDSRFGIASPFCKSSIEILSGERINAICPSRGGRLMVTPDFISLSHRA